MTSSKLELNPKINMTLNRTNKSSCLLGEGPWAQDTHGSGVGRRLPGVMLCVIIASCACEGPFKHTN